MKRYTICIALAALLCSAPLSADDKVLTKDLSTVDTEADETDVENLEDEPKSMQPLFEAILSGIPAPEGDPDAPVKLLISTIDYNEYVGRIGVGRIENGSLSVNEECLLMNAHDLSKKERIRISKLYIFDGLRNNDIARVFIFVIIMQIAFIGYG